MNGGLRNKVVGPQVMRKLVIIGRVFRGSHCLLLHVTEIVIEMDPIGDSGLFDIIIDPL